MRLLVERGGTSFFFTAETGRTHQITPLERMTGEDLDLRRVGEVAAEFEGVAIQVLLAAEAQPVFRVARQSRLYFPDGMGLPLGERQRQKHREVIHRRRIAQMVLVPAVVGEDRRLNARDASVLQGSDFPSPFSSRKGAANIRFAQSSNFSRVSSFF